VAQTTRLATFFVYLVPLAGWLFPLLFMRRQTFVFYHACQALALNLVAVVVPLAWLVFSWLVAWVPLGGPVTAAASFALVIAAYAALAVAWIVGMLHALRLQAKAVPIYGAWGDRLFYRLSPDAT
jgi:uncharacterized membrane protein